MPGPYQLPLAPSVVDRLERLWPSPDGQTVPELPRQAPLAR